MANVKISELPNATSLSNGDSFPVVQGGVTKQAARFVLFASPTFTGTTTAAILTATGDVTFDGGAFVFNDSGADKDARFEGDTDANLLFLDASTDRVGVGTATPGAKLDVNGGAAINGNVTLTGDVVLANDQYLYWGVGDGSAYVRGNSSSDYVSFGTVGVERMRLDSSGNVGIGTTSPAHRLDVTGAQNSVQARFGAVANRGLEISTAIIAGTNDAGSVLNAKGATSGTLIFQTDSVERMRLDASGNLFCQGVYDNTSGSAANVFVASNGLLQRSTSSLKYKTDIQDAAYGLADVMRLRPVTYKSKTDGDRVFGGLIAEEVHSAGLTEFVQYADDGSPDALAYGNMVSLLTKAIQEQQAVINELRARVAALEAG